MKKKKESLRGRTLFFCVRYFEIFRWYGIKQASRATNGSLLSVRRGERQMTFQEVKEDIYFCYLNSIPLKNLEELYNLFYENLLEEQEILRRKGELTLEVKKEFEEKLENLSIYNILYEFSERKAESVYGRLLYE